MQVIKADTIDVAVEGILNELNKSRQNIIYFDGWEGLGASAVLQVIARRLELKEPTRPPGLDFEQVIHIDCSKWESTRALQREIAEQLKLSNWVMKMFDKQDEEDDFNGTTDQGSRTEIADVAAEIQRSMQGRRFLLVFHNGSNEEIDISRIGLSVYPYLTNKVIWTFQGRFRMDPKMKDKVMKNTTDVLLSASCYKKDREELWSYLLHQEATQVACKHDISPAIVVECFLYLLGLNCIRGHLVDTEYDLAIHTCNYWICDRIIQKIPDSGEEAWQVGQTLQGEIRLGMCYQQNDLTPHLVMHTEKRPHWTSPAYGYVLVPAGVVPSRMFQHIDKLGVISRCSFSFSWPPFMWCHGLRFLWLDHCQDLRSTDAEWRKDEEDTTRSWACFQSLWVLDLRYTDCDWILSARVMDLMTQLRELNVMGAENWDMSHLRGRLCNIRKLRVRKSTCFFSNNVFSEMDSMELLDFSGNTITQGMTSLSGPASNSSLKCVTIDGCDGLKIISFRGCKELANVFLKGLLRGLEELELSGTRVKTLNLTGVEARSLPKRIILLGCEKLRAILWPPSVTQYQLPNVLHIDTTPPSATAYGGEAPLVHPHVGLSLQQQKEEIFKSGWRIRVTDARLLRSLSAGFSALHIDICTAAVVGGSNIQGTSSNKLVQVQPHTSILMHSKYSDTFGNDTVAAVIMEDCPKIWQSFTIHTCFMKVMMHGQGNKLLEDAVGASTSALLLPKCICDLVTSLHVYDNLSITSIPGPPQGSGWHRLRWCRVERCPRLHTVFTVPHGTSEDLGEDSFRDLETLSASKLLYALYIWDRQVEKGYLNSLVLLHLDHCPRLVHVLPFAIRTKHTLYYLETLEIVYCGDLKEVFPLPLSPELQEQNKILEFPSLKRIHLHELPKLQRIYGRSISAPYLETVKIRGCWSLRRPPAVGRYTEPPKVECEKEWWDNLEWDGLEEYHHPSLYEPTHSLYYKKAQLPRGTVLW
ncbi:unnamed protein product [Triticum turgidum subsp. durum]|uniref:NB-ARC domain-containing protein n=1 Tax=Triticum turgidum subsp. durum TaxID=4567 RepID=A0A9R0XRH1_TRITD|nr:unnamed protein product [Triticum turgidum subsp. durum]